MITAKQKRAHVKALYWGGNRRCFYCQRPLNRDEVTLDHLVPRSKGGTNERGNLVISCLKCNQAKGDKL